MLRIEAQPRKAVEQRVQRVGHLESRQVLADADMGLSLRHAWSAQAGQQRPVGDWRLEDCHSSHEARLRFMG